MFLTSGTHVEEIKSYMPQELMPCGRRSDSSFSYNWQEKQKVLETDTRDRQEIWTSQGCCLSTGLEMLGEDNSSVVLEDRGETEQESSLLLSVSVVQGSRRVARSRSWSMGDCGTERGGWSVHGSRGYFTAACNKDQVTRCRGSAHSTCCCTPR